MIMYYFMIPTLFFLLDVGGQSVTLYDVSLAIPTSRIPNLTTSGTVATASDTISAVGVDSSKGETTYVEKIIITKAEDAAGRSKLETTFINSNTQTLINTIVEGASGYHATFPLVTHSPVPSSVSIDMHVANNCTFSASQAICAQEIVEPVAVGSETTLTTTFTGALVPITTIPAFSGQATQTSSGHYNGLYAVEATMGASLVTMLALLL